MDSSDPHYTMAQRRIGTVIGKRYTIDRVLGVGGMAVVYAATHRNQKKVAIKMLHPELSHHVEIRQRFLREGYVANTVKHRGAVDVIDDDVAEDGAAFLVMEYLDGQTVEDVATARGGRLDLQTTVAIGHELCSVMAAAHTAGIVHRDIKPANLFITTDGDVKVLDFGIARLRDSGGVAVTNAGMLLGTPGYMSPEQALGHGDSIGAHTDTWAIGATMFNLLTGRTVHEGQSGPEIVVRAATNPARSVRSLVADLPSAVVEVIDRALRFDRAERWQNAGDMKTALRDAHRALFGDMFAQVVLAPLVGGSPRVDRSPSSPSQPPGNTGNPALRSPQAETIVDRPIVSTTTAIPVSSTSFVQPLASKKTLAFVGGALVLALAIGGGYVAMSGLHKSPPPTTASMIQQPATADIIPPPSTPIAEATPAALPAPAASSVAPAAALTPVKVGVVANAQPKINPVPVAPLAPVAAASSVAPAAAQTRPDPGAVR